MNYDAGYNPSADPAFDKAPFTGEDAADVAAADTSAKTIAQEGDVQRTDSHERPSKFEVHSLLSDVREDERGVSGGTRGKKVDAYKQERAVNRVTEHAERLDIMRSET